MMSRDAKGLYLSALDDHGSGEDESAVKFLKRSARGGCVEGQYTLGLIHLNGDWGLKEDSGRALFWFKKAADKDFPDALNNLGAMYLYGIGIKEDPYEAASLLKKAIKVGDSSNARCSLGEMHLSGAGSVRKSLTLALKQWEKAVESGNSRALVNLIRHAPDNIEVNELIGNVDTYYSARYEMDGESRLMEFMPVISAIREARS
jgi:hypothetical protein